MLMKAQEKGAANYMLAKMYENALGVKKNSVLSYRHYKKAHELAHDNHVADMKRLQKRMTKKERQAAKYVTKKEAAKAKELAKSCGRPYSDKDAKVLNRKIHLVGVGVKPINEANGFIVYGEKERLYYIIDAEMASKIKPYEYIDIQAKSTSNAITVSSDTGTLQAIYQFHVLKNCSKK